MGDKEQWLNKPEANHQKYKALMGHSISAIFLTKPSGEIIEANKAAEVMFGYSEQELRKIGRKGIIDHSDENIQQKLIERDKKGSVQGELTGIRKDGRRFPIEFSSTLFSIGNKNLYSYTLINDISERKRTEMEISLMINNTDEGFVLLDKRLNIINFNSQFREINKAYFGREIKKGDPILDYIQPARKQQAKNILLEALRGKVQTSEITIPSINLPSTDSGIAVQEPEITSPLKNADFRFFSAKYVPSKNSKQEIIGVFITMRDVTREIDAQNEISKKQLLLEQAEVNYREIFEKAVDGIFIHELKTGKIIAVNQKSCEILGYDKTSLINSGLEIISTGLDGFTSENFLEKLVLASAGKPQLFEWTFQKKDGGISWFEVSLEKANVAGNDRILAFFRVINDRKKSEVLLRESIQRYEYVTKATNEAIWDWMIEENKVFWGETYLRLFGKMEDENLSDHDKVVKRLHPEEIDEVLSSADKAIKSKVKNWKYEHRYLKSDGEYAYVNNKALIIRDNSGRAIRVIGAMQDISESKNEALNKALLTEIGLLFNLPIDLVETLDKVIEKMASKIDFSFAGIWLNNRDRKSIHRVSHYSKDNNPDFSNASPAQERGAGWAGMAWETKKIQFFNSRQQRFESNSKLKNHPLKTGIALPIKAGNEVIGSLTLGFPNDKSNTKAIVERLKNLASYLGPEIKRKQLEQDLNKIFNFAPDIIALWGLDGCFKKINQAACDLLEYSEKELMAEPFIKFVHPDDRDKTAVQLKNLRLGNPTLYFENRYITKSGKIKWMGWTSISYPEEGSIYSVAKDITEKKQLEELLRKATSLARIGSWEVDLTTNLIYWSDITREIHETGPDYQPVLKGGVNFYKKGKSREKINKLVTAAIENGAPWDAELKIITAKGNERWVRTIGEPEMVNGKCVRIYGSFQEIDERKKAEEKIRSSEERQKLIMNSALDAIICIDLKGEIFFWNPQAEKIFGWNENEVLGKPLDKIIVPEKYRQAHQEGMKNYLKTGQGFILDKLIHFSALKKGGIEFPIELTISPIQQEGNEFFCAFIRDITDRKRSESLLVELNNNLKKQTEELAKSNEDLEQFAYVASHDLQEPLRMISSFLNQLNRKYDNILDEKGKKYIYYAVDGAVRMRQIILDLLEFSRVGKTQEAPESINLNIIVDDVKVLFRKEIKDKKATLHIKPLPIIQGYKTPIRQIFQNLIGNSLKYSKKSLPAQVHIEALEDEDFWQIAVSDNGIGIDEAFFDRIFIIFQRLHTKETYPGTGMGLAVTKKLIESQGGKIWVTSKINAGSTFHFTLPKNPRSNI
jgi:PAS domain S-box-containing protein